jgi:hypothetical protein
MTSALFTMITKFKVPELGDGSIAALNGIPLEDLYTPQLLLAALGEVSGVMQGNKIMQEGGPVVSLQRWVRFLTPK